MPTNPSPTPKRQLPPEILARCRDLRHNLTNAESYLWLFLRNRGLKNVKFRRQHPIGPYVLDFYCHESKLAIEVDGSGHLDETQARNDALRTEYLLQQGIRVLRFFNNQVLGDVEGVLSVIWEELPD